MYRVLIFILLLYGQKLSAQAWYLIQDKYVINRSDPFSGRLDSGLQVHPYRQWKTQDIHSLKWYNLVGKQDLLPLLSDTSNLIVNDKANVAGLQLLCMDLYAPAKKLMAGELLRRIRTFQKEDLQGKDLKNLSWQDMYCLKSLSMAGSASGSLFLREGIQAFELLFFDNPYPSCKSKKLNIAVHFHQQAVPNSIITIYRLSGTKWKKSGQINTNATGIALFEPRVPGVYCLLTRKLEAPTNNNEVWTAWNSCLTFEVR